MSGTSTTTSTPVIRFIFENGQTDRLTWAKWKGEPVEVRTSANEETCADYEHDLEVMHHYGEGGTHVCPTTLLMCKKCTGIADEPPPYSCWINFTSYSEPEQEVE